MKDSYVRFRCTEQEKAIIEKMALHDPMTENMSDYILSLIKDDYKRCHEVEVFSVVRRKGQEIGRKSLGFYLVDEYGRTSKFKAYKEICKKSHEFYTTFRQTTQQDSYIEVNGVNISQIPTNRTDLTEYAVLDTEANDKLNK